MYTRFLIGYVIFKPLVHYSRDASMLYNTTIIHLDDVLHYLQPDSTSQTEQRTISYNLFTACTPYIYTHIKNDII